ncbi:MAG: protein kinase domain-containing protein [Phycisphaerae bacterium]
MAFQMSGALIIAGLRRARHTFRQKLHPGRAFRMGLASRLFRAIAITASKIGVKKLAYALGTPYGAGTVVEGAVDFGIGVFEDLCRQIGGGPEKPPSASNIETALEPTTQNEVRRQIAEIARSSAPQAAAQMSTALAEIAPEMPEQDRALLTSYASILPERVRRTLQRPEDPTGRTVPADLPMRTALDLAAFLPPMPRFAAGEEPVYNRTLVRLLGSGTFGEVWEARKSGFADRRVALKFCLGEDAALLHEARLAQRLDHPGIVRLEEIHPRRGEVPLCLEYEFVDGTDLASWFLANPVTNAQRGQFVAEVVADLADIVHAAHDHGRELGRPEPIVHRDLKPANVLVPARPRGSRFKVTDFGIGAILRTAEENQQATRIRTLGRLGSSFTLDALASHTPRYAPDEQISGAVPDPRNDIFALGVIWWQLLLGDFNKSAPRGVGWKRQLRALSVSDDMISLIERCVDSDPAERPEHAGALVNELRVLLGSPAPPVAALAATPVEVNATAAHPPRTAQPPQSPLLQDTPELREQIALIEEAARESLGLDPNASLDIAAWSRVTALDLFDDAITDAGMAWLARADTGLKALTALNLTDTKVTDAGLAQLARPNTGLKNLTTLNLCNTLVTDAGLTELAHADTGLKALTELNLIHTTVTDAGLSQLARPSTGLKAVTQLKLWHAKLTDAGVMQLARADSGLKALTTLDLYYTQVTDAGLTQLARPDTGLKALITLGLKHTRVTDAGLTQLARPDTGLKALIALDLGYTKATDAGLTQLARAESGLKALTTLNLSGTQVSDAGVAQLARADTGLKALTTLELSDTQVTDAGLALLARADSGPKALTTLDLRGTKVTDEGLAQLARADTGLKALSTLNLGRTKVTDAGLAQLARADSGLKALTTLSLAGTKVTDAGVAALREARPNLLIIR